MKPDDRECLVCGAPLEYLGVAQAQGKAVCTREHMNMQCIGSDCPFIEATHAL